MSAQHETFPHRWRLILMWTPTIALIAAISCSALIAGTALRVVRGLMNRTGD